MHTFRTTNIVLEKEENREAQGKETYLTPCKMTTTTEIPLTISLSPLCLSRRTPYQE